MRISTISMYQNATTNFNNLQSSVANSINQISTGLKLSTPADNPAAAAQVLITTQQSAVNTQLAANRVNITSALSSADGMLSGVTNLMQSLSSMIVEAGNGSLSASDRTTLAQQFQGSIAQLMNLANSKDANGNYLFSGSTVGTPPFVTSSNGARYQGNQIQQMMQADTSQQMPVTLAGNTIFGNIQVSPNAYFGIANANNTSTATISTGVVTNAAAVTYDNYSITFTSSTAFDVVNTSTGVTVSTNNAYTSGAAITIAGIQFSVSDGVSGANTVPAAGDQFSVQPGNQNIFQALTNVLNALSKPLNTPGDRTNFANAVQQANSSIASSLNNVLTARGQIGNFLQQVSSLDSVGSTVKLSYQKTLSTLQDVNYAEAISQLSFQQFTYQAAQQVFAKTSQLSLISMLR